MSRLTERLPKVRGVYTPNAPMAELTWFRAGGPAEVLYRPADVEDLQDFLAGKPHDVPVTVVGVGSNLLVRDGGIGGVVIRLGAAFGKIAAEEGHRMRAGAAALDVGVARAAADAGIDGLAFLRGIPGTVGGGLRMNAGAYGGEFKDVLVEAIAVDGKGGLHRFAPADLGMTYRHTTAPADLIFVEALFQGRPGDPATIRAQMDEITAKREASQPVRTRTGGSTFKNPDPAVSGGRKAWQLIDAAGCRGLRRGDAMVSELHCNFLVNLSEAKANDIEALGEEVRARVGALTGVNLEWEIKRIGIA
ncbi:MAG: UDP-N-acetylmuramate dehydrogenase [Alphaproteobacteria bacterium]|nr:UDP-N-acetylmuramate dehydrogenase [Alphaproteobacteria bacterium]